MIPRAAVIEWFEENDMGSNVDVADLFDRTEGFVRTEGRRRHVPRVGSTMVWDLDTALGLYDDLAAEEDEEAEDDEGEEDFEDEDLEDEDDDFEDEDLDDEDDDDLDFDPDEEDDDE
jgi:hypothetical protein